MFKMFYPDEYVVSTYVIHFEKMYEQGYRGLIFDIDNTLVQIGRAHVCPTVRRQIAVHENYSKDFVKSDLIPV